MLSFSEALAQVRKDQPGVGDVHISNAGGDGKKKKKLVKDITIPIIKFDDDEKRLVYGWASVIKEDGKEVVDVQGDMIDVDTIQKAAHDFMLNQRNVGNQHGTFGPHIGSVVESMVLTEDLQNKMGIDLGKSGWMICAKIADDKVWQDVKSGRLAAFSIGGTGVREEV